MKQLTTNSKNVDLQQFLDDTEQTATELHNTAAVYINGRFYSTGDLSAMQEDAAEGFAEGHSVEIVQVIQKQYMNLATGSVDTYEGWWYENGEGQRVNAVDLGEVVEVVEVDGEWEQA